MVSGSRSDAGIESIWGRLETPAYFPAQRRDLQVGGNPHRRRKGGQRFSWLQTSDSALHSPLGRAVLRAERSAGTGTNPKRGGGRWGNKKSGQKATRPFLHSSSAFQGEAQCLLRPDISKGAGRRGGLSRLRVRSNPATSDLCQLLGAGRVGPHQDQLVPKSIRSFAGGVYSVFDRLSLRAVWESLEEFDFFLQSA